VPARAARGVPAPGRSALARLARHKDAVLAFASHQEERSTDNLAERDAQPARPVRKVSSPSRALPWARVHARAQGSASTAREQGRNTFRELESALDAHGFLSVKCEMA